MNIIRFIFCLALLGSVTNVNAFFTSLNAKDQDNQILKNKGKRTYGTKIRVIKTDDFDKNFKELLEEGYVSIKSEVFKINTGDYGYNQAVEQMKNKAKKLGAEVILFSNDNQGSSISEQRTVQTINHQTSNSNKENDIYNNRLAKDNMDGTYMGSFVREYSWTEYMSNYLIRFNSRTGIYPTELTDLDRQIAKQSSGGVKAIVIKEGFPAFGIIYEQDIILKIDGQIIHSVTGFIETTNFLKRGFVKVEILRNGKKETKIIALNK
ncbi:PDZ domain-containing protein [Acinetobacter rongchengensis]|nr:PDZ domain-containing protein [Acinetobacter rongchengensis]